MPGVVSLFAYQCDMDNPDKKILLFCPGFPGGNEVSDILKARNYSVHYVSKIPGLLKALNNLDFDLAVFALSTGQENITDLAATIRSLCSVPVLFVLQEVPELQYMHRLRGCSDDFITSPVSEDELILRVELVVSCYSRSEGKKKRDVFEIGRMLFDHRNQVLHTPDGARDLTRIESQLLHMLCLYRNRILSREVALETIWGQNDYFKSRSMDVYVAKLRKLFIHEDSISITNIHNVGFRLNIDKSGHGQDNA
jgi:two-component system, OmpR family, response regulator